MAHVYECELYEEDGKICVDLPAGFSGTVRVGNREDAVDKVAEKLKTEIIRKTLEGESLPNPPKQLRLRHSDGVPLVVCLDIKFDNLYAVTAKEASEILGLTRARVSQMIDEGLLSGYKEGRNVYVMISGIKARLNELKKR